MEQKGNLQNEIKYILQGINIQNLKGIPAPQKQQWK